MTSALSAALGAALVASAEARMAELAEWTEEELVHIAAMLPTGADLRMRLRVCDHLDAGGRIVRRDVRLDGDIVAGCTVEWPTIDPP